MQISLSMMLALLRRQPTHSWANPSGTKIYIAVENVVIELDGEPGEFSNLTELEIMELGVKAFDKRNSQA